MTSVSITKLKENPTKIIGYASDYPVAVENRNEVQAYLVGKELYEKLFLLVEDIIDSKAVELDDPKDRIDFEEFASELGL